MLAVAVPTLCIDLATKAIARSYLDHPINLGLFDLSLVENTGVAFGLGANLPPWVLLIATTVVLAGVSLVILREGASLLGGGLIVGGAMGNLADRLLGGSVTDFLSMPWWPAFNVADVVIVVGVGILLISAAPRRSRQAS